MDYTILKSIHQATVALSFVGFFARGVAMLGDVAWIRSRVARTAPHVVDTILLASAIALLWTLHISPIQVSWIIAKIIGLFVYIGLGFVALRLGKTKAVRAIAWVAAMGVFGYIVSVALSKNPWGFLTEFR